MARKVSQGQPGQGLSPAEPSRLRHTLFDQGIGELLPAPRPAAHQAVELRVHDDVGQALDIRLYAFSLQDRLELLARKVAAAGQGPDYGRVAFGDQRFIQLEFPVRGCQESLDLGRRQLEQPADVLRHDEMPGGAHHVDPEDGPFVESLLDVRVGGTPDPEAQGPFRRRVILRLDRAQAGDRRRGALEQRPAEAGIAQAHAQDIGTVHVMALSPSRTRECSMPSNSTSGTPEWQPAKNGRAGVATGLEGECRAG